MTEATFTPGERAVAELRPSASPRMPRVAAAVARFLWLIAVPSLGAAATLHHLVPSPAAAAGTWAEGIARLVATHRVGTFLVLALAFGAVARSFSDWLPPTAFPRAIAARRRALDSVVLVLVALGLGFGLRLVTGTFEVLSASMLPTLEPQDVVAGVRGAFIGKASQTGARVDRGDVIVFRRSEGLEGPEHMIKRVVGLPGDTITMNGPHVVINGWEAPSCDAGAYFYPLPGGGGVAGRLLVEFIGESAHLAVVIPFEASWPETYQVKSGEVFVLGDNRSNSADSRAWNDGRGKGVPLPGIVARATRRISGVLRDESLDLGRTLSPIDLNVRLDGIDTSELSAGIAHCLSTRPQATHPPDPHAAR